MEVILKIVAAKMTTVTIIDGKELSLDSFFLDIQSDTNSIFIVGSRNSLMSIDSIAFDNTILFMWCFSRFKMWNLFIDIFFAVDSCDYIQFSLVLAGFCQLLPF